MSINMSTKEARQSLASQISMLTKHDVNLHWLVDVIDQSVLEWSAARDQKTKKDLRNFNDLAVSKYNDITGRKVMRAISK